MIMRNDRFIRSLMAMTIALSGAVVPAISTMATAPVDLTLIPAGQTVQQGDIFEVRIQAQSGSQQVIGVDAYLDFDSTKLTVVDMNLEKSGIQISGGIALPILLWNSANNSTGHISYSAGAFGPYPEGTFTVATIRFQALATSQAAPVTFSSSFDRPTLVVGATRAADITGTLTGATYIISSDNTPAPSGGSSGGGEGASGKTLNTSGLPADIALTITSIPQDPLSEDNAGIEEAQATPATTAVVQTSPVLLDSIIAGTPKGTPTEERPPINSAKSTLKNFIIVAVVLIGITGIILVTRKRTKNKP